MKERCPVPAGSGVGFLQNAERKEATMIRNHLASIVFSASVLAACGGSAPGAPRTGTAPRPTWSPG
jgi:hypothetical protein